MKLIVVSSSKPQEQEARIVTELFEHGLMHFHLRKPSMRTREMRQLLDEIPEHFYDRIVIHSHHALANDYKLGGIHLTKSHLRRKFTTWLRIKLLHMQRKDATISTTFHKIGSVYEKTRDYNYVLLGTIFDPVSGKFNAGYSEHSLRAALEKSQYKIVARGGTVIENIETCASLGFYGMAFASSVWKTSDPVKAFCEVLEKFKELGLQQD